MTSNTIKTKTLVSEDTNKTVEYDMPEKQLGNEWEQGPVTGLVDTTTAINQLDKAVDETKTQIGKDWELGEVTGIKVGCHYGKE